jgi:hypothetical protein
VASQDWEEIRKYVEPVVSEISQPGAELARIEVVLHGDGQESTHAEFSYDGQTAERNAALVRHAAALLPAAADRIERGRSRP